LFRIVRERGIGEKGGGGLKKGRKEGRRRTNQAVGKI